MGTSLGFTSSELRPLFEDAVAAFLEWRASMTHGQDLAEIAAGPECAWRGTMQFLAAASDSARVEVLEARVASAQCTLAERLTALLAIAEVDRRRACELIDVLADDPRHHQLIREVVSLWPGPVEALIAARASASGSPSARLWLELALAHRVDPGPEVIESLLSSEARDALIVGLELLPVHAECDRHRDRAHALMNACEPDLAAAAVAVGVFLGHPIAWLRCRQLATAPGQTRATQLVASLGSTAAQDSLLDWAAEVSPTGPCVWALASSGRPRAAAIATSAAIADPSSHWARAAMFHVLGPPCEGTPGELLVHWRTMRDELVDDERYLLGLPLTRELVATCFSFYLPAHQRLLADELWFRSRGQLRLAPLACAAATLDQATLIGTLELELDGPSF